MFEIKFKKLLQKVSPSIVFEFGSFDGRDAVKYRSWLPDSQIYSFEPNPFIFESLKKTLDEKDIKSFKLAFGNRVAEYPFSYTQSKINDSYGSGGTLMYPSDECMKNNPDLRFRNRDININVTTIQKFCEEHGIVHIDFMHIDVEGYVLNVLEGFGNIKPLVIYAEVIGMEKLFIGALSYKEYNDIFHKMGYEELYINEEESAVVYILKDYINTLITPEQGEILIALNKTKDKISELTDSIKNLQDNISIVSDFFKLKILNT